MLFIHSGCSLAYLRTILTQPGENSTRTFKDSNSLPCFSSIPPGWKRDLTCVRCAKIDTLETVLKNNGKHVASLSFDKFVASKIEFSRRREKLSWSHHYEVAALEPAQQDELLDQAEAERLSMRQLRQAVKELIR